MYVVLYRYGQRLSIVDHLPTDIEKLPNYWDINPNDRIYYIGYSPQHSTHYFDPVILTNEISELFLTGDLAKYVGKLFKENLRKLIEDVNSLPQQHRVTITTL